MQCNRAEVMEAEKEEGSAVVAGLGIGGGLPAMESG